MSDSEICARICYRCDKIVRMTAEEFRLTACNDWTICPECRVKLDVEASFAGSPATAVRSLS